MRKLDPCHDGRATIPWSCARGRSRCLAEYPSRWAAIGAVAQRLGIGRIETPRSTGWSVAPGRVCSRCSAWIGADVACTSHKVGRSEVRPSDAQVSVVMRRLASIRPRNGGLLGQVVTVEVLRLRPRRHARSGCCHEPEVYRPG